MKRFVNRKEAGRRLAAALERYREEHPVILGLPRGGVPVAYEVARALEAPLDVWVVRKLGIPWHPELGVGAVSEGGRTYVSWDIIRRVGLSELELDAVIEQKRAEVEERVQRFREGRPKPDIAGRTVILVDDGIATGGTVHAALRAIRAEAPKQVILAVPVAASQTLEELAGEADHVVALMAPPDLYAIGLWYEDFTQVPDSEVVRLLDHMRPGDRGGEHVIA